MNSKSKCFGLLVFCFGFTSVVFAQNNLSLKQAFEMALQNNFSIQIASNDYTVSRLNNSVGNAGMLPSINGLVTQDNQQLDTKQKFLNGNENNRDGAKSNQLNAAVELNWTLFNGMKMFATKNKLEELQAMGKTRLNQQIEGVLTRVARSYMEVVLASAQLKSAEEFVRISEKRLQFAKDRFMAGKSSKAEVLNAQVNLNSDMAAYKRLETQYKNSKLNLTQLLGMELTFDFAPSDSLNPAEAMVYDEIKMAAASQNSGLKMAALNKDVAQYQLREIQSERYPVLQFKSGYSYSRSQSEAGFLQSANNSGFHYGGALTLNVFNGFDVDRRIHNAQLNYKNAGLLYKDSLLKVDIAVTQAFNVYQTNLELYQFEQKNVQVAKENFDIAREQYEVGLISLNDLRVAQVNYLQTINRMLSSAFETRMSEMELKRLSGKLL